MKYWLQWDWRGERNKPQLLERLKVRRLGKEKDKLDDARKINRREESKKDSLKEARKQDWKGNASDSADWKNTEGAKAAWLKLWTIERRLKERLKQRKM